RGVGRGGALTRIGREHEGFGEAGLYGERRAAHLVAGILWIGRRLRHRGEAYLGVVHLAHLVDRGLRLLRRYVALLGDDSRAARSAEHTERRRDPNRH